ncbi:hypothetical protein [Streptomyces minutiscleroticus]|uniref:Uncharacterized protein n=1 Tax=Streptomyces minutiscleroticus TaxID=68238 RepID=A0A918KEX4_9ACTN|nr:hypothetical protein [Streptomyces minutiscleroticus]GGX58725.1 hypothetical protein GCM10010358_11020 [Streptomyces minutiscleroticus]
MPDPAFAPQLAEKEIAAHVSEAVDELTRRIALDTVCFSAGAPDPADPAAADRRRALARLYVLTVAEQAVQQLESQAARAAAAAGAGYPEIGQASNMSRQGARRRWPGLVAGGSVSPHSRHSTRSS